MWKQKIHISWLIAVFCLSFVIGVWLALYVWISSWWLILGVVAAGVIFWQRRIFLIPILVGAGLLIGIGHGSVGRGGLEVYEPLMGQDVTIEGKVREDPSLTNKGKLALQLDQIKLGSHGLPASIWTSVGNNPNIKRGDVVKLKGSVGEGFGTFPALLQNAIVVSITRPSPGDIGRVVRDWFADNVRKGVPEPQASLGIGYLTGQKSALPPDLADALQIAGLSHIVVASGYNLTILVRLARRLFLKVSKFLSALSSGLMIASFVAVTGLSPSMTRAGLVASLSLLAWYYGRRFHPFVLLPFAAAITVGLQPSYIWGDLGWQLSFSAFAGVMIVAPLLQRFFFGDKKPGTFRQILGETVAAHLVTIPIVVLAFGVLSNVAIPANLLIVPLVPLAMLLTFIVGIVALIIPVLLPLIGTPTHWLLTYMTTVAQYAADLPWAQIEIKLEWWFGLIYYALLGAACFVAWKITKYDLRDTNLVE